MFGRRPEYDRRMRIDHFVHFDPSPGGPPDTRIDQLLGLVQALGASMATLQEAVAAVKDRVLDKDAQQEALIVDLQAQLADANGQLTTALGNDAADAQTIADKQAEIDAQAAANDAAIAELATINPIEDLPPVDEPPVEPPVA